MHLLFKKEITPTDNIAFLILEKNVGRICFIDCGIPQFIREFSLSSQTTEAPETVENLNLKIIISQIISLVSFYICSY